MLFKIWVKSAQGSAMVGGRWERRYTWHVHLSGLTEHEAQEERSKLSLTAESPEIQIRPEGDNSLWGA